MTDSPSERLCYYGTNDEVRVGDRVRMKRWVRRDLVGTVCYVPGLSPVHPELEYEGVKYMAIRLPDGTLRVGGYYPVKGRWLSKGLVLISRGHDEGLDPNEQLEAPGDERYP